MAWRCRDCDRRYHEPPAACVCGSEALEPDDAGTDGAGRPSRISLSAARQRLLDPLGADRSLVEPDERITLAFRLLLAFLAVTAVVVAVQLLL